MTRRGRHAVTGRRDGPVTIAFRIAAAPHRRPFWIAARVWPVIPALFLLPSIVNGSLTRFADPVIGFDATLCLVACLAVTPFITVARMKIARLRWWYGLWVFVLGAAGLAIHLAYPPGSVAQRAAGTAVNWTGLLIVILLFPMAATSSAAAQKLMGPEWKRWQRGLVWFVWAVIGIHLALMHTWLVTGAYLASTAPAVLLRRPRVRNGIKAWRRDRYSTGGWWVVLGALGALALAGLLVLAGEEVRSAVRAATLGS